MVGAGRIYPKGVHHIVGHLDLYLVKKPTLGRVKRVVEIKDPTGDIREMLFHGRRLGRSVRQGNHCLHKFDRQREKLSLVGQSGYHFRTNAHRADHEGGAGS